MPIKVKILFKHLFEMELFNLILNIRKRYTYSMKIMRNNNILFKEQQKFCKINWELK